MPRRFFIALAFSILSLTARPALCVDYVYTANGGTFTATGSVGALNFTNATWVLTATADPIGIQSGVVSSNIPAYFLSSTVTLKLTDSVNGTTSMTLSNPVGATWGIMSLDYSTVFVRPGAGFLDFQAFTNGGSPWTAQSDGAGILGGGSFGGNIGFFNNLGSTGSWSGGFASFFNVGSTLSTSLGTLSVVSVANVDPGSFTITAVPEPSTYVTGLLATTAILALSRRRKRSN